MLLGDGTGHGNRVGQHGKTRLLLSIVLLEVLYLVLSHFVHFAVHVGWRSLAIAHTTAHARTSRALEIWIIRSCHDAELPLQLLQAEYSRAVATLHPSQSLAALHFAAKMTRLDALMICLTRAFHEPLYTSAINQKAPRPWP